MHCYRTWDNRSKKTRTEVLHKMVGAMLHRLGRPSAREATERPAWRARLRAAERALVQEIESWAEGDKPACSNQLQLPILLEAAFTKDSSIAQV
jgi:hypothetical protein